VWWYVLVTVTASPAVALPSTGIESSIGGSQSFSVISSGIGPPSATARNSARTITW